MSYDKDGAGLVLKPIGWFSNSLIILEEVSRRCSNGSYGTWHRHVVLEGGRAKVAERYPPMMITRFLEGSRSSYVKLEFWL